MTLRPPDDKHNLDASSAALEFLKHLLTLSSGVLVLSGTFVSKIQVLDYIALTLLVGSWGCQIVCLFSSLNAISGVIQSRIKRSDSWASGKTQLYASAGKWSFLIGLILFGLFASYALLSPVIKHETCRGRSSEEEVEIGVEQPDTSGKGNELYAEDTLRH